MPNFLKIVLLFRNITTPGGTTGFSTNSNAIHGWVINGPYIGGMEKQLNDFVQLRQKSHLHLPTRIKQDENAVKSLIDILTNTLLNPFSDNPLLCISNGMLASDEVKNDLLNPKEMGQEALIKFKEDRLSASATKSLFDPMKKLKLKTFSYMTKTVKTTVNQKSIPMKATRNLFAHITLIMEKRQLDLKTVFCYPLGPFPWSLVDSNGGLKKTSKVSILHELERDTEPVVEPIVHHESIIDGMAMLQKRNVIGLTYGQLANKILKLALSISLHTERIDVFFDT